MNDEEKDEVIEGNESLNDNDDPTNSRLFDHFNKLMILLIVGPLIFWLVKSFIEDPAGTFLFILEIIAE